MAKINADQLTKKLQQSISPVYLVTGDDPLLLMEACDSIRQTAKTHGFIERELYSTDSNFHWDTLIESNSAMSLFAEKKIIEIRIHNGKPGDSGSKAIQEYCAHINDDTLLLLVSPKLDKRTLNSKWCSEIADKGELITVWPVNAQQFPRWIHQRLLHAGIKADEQAIEILCAKVEGNLLAAVQEIEKLKVVADDKNIDAQTMAKLVSNSARYDVFGLVDKALLGDMRSASKMLHGLKSEGTEPLIVLWALTKEIRTLAAIKEATQEGKSIDAALNAFHVWQNRKQIVKHAYQRMSLDQLYLLMKKLSQTDKTIKGLMAGDSWNLLLDVILSLSGTDILSQRTSSLNLSC